METKSFSWFLNSAVVAGFLVTLGYVVGASRDQLFLGTITPRSKEAYFNAAGNFLFDSIGLLLGSLWLGLFMVALFVLVICIRPNTGWLSRKIRSEYIFLALALCFVVKLPVLDAPVFKLEGLLFSASNAATPYGTKSFQAQEANRLRRMIACTHAQNDSAAPCLSVNWNEPLFPRAWGLLCHQDLTVLTVSQFVSLNLALTILISTLGCIAFGRSEPESLLLRFGIVAAIALSWIGYTTAYAKLLEPATFRFVQITFRDKTSEGALSGATAAGKSHAGLSPKPNKSDAKVCDKQCEKNREGQPKTGIQTGYLLAESETEYTLFDKALFRISYIPRDQVQSVFATNVEDILAPPQTAAQENTKPSSAP